MKIFLDSADLMEISAINELGIIDGLTTNPSLMSKNSSNFYETISEICKIINTDVSVEVVGQETEQMIIEGNKVLKIAPNIVIKLPMTWAGLKACKYFIKNKNKVNMTLCFSANQALLAAKMGATYISPFIGRLEDTGPQGINLLQDIRAGKCSNGIQLIRDIRHIYNNYNFSTQILAASIRNQEHFYKAALSAADAITVSGNIIKQLVNHKLTDEGLKIFINDWENSKLKI